MNKVVLVVWVSALLVSASRDAPLLSPNAERHWEYFIQRYQKQYTPVEVISRFSIFKENLLKIDLLNEEDPTAYFGITKFADVTSAEFVRGYLMPSFKPSFNIERYEPIERPLNDELPLNFDWRSKNAVTPVKDQGQCGSCWAFSATEEIESQWILKGHPAVELSPQQIVDCDKTDGGCGGGDTPTAYEYAIKAGGMEKESNYPYKAKDEKCQFNKSDIAVTITGWKYVVKGKNETEMQNALYNGGPLSICVDAEPWQHYTKGVLSSKCGHSLDHCVELVGYGVDNSTNIAFWSIRNSWGKSWGEDGYIRVERDKDNLCGVASEVTVAII
jgi:cathepsin F